jgi:hypothetical protein
MFGFFKKKKETSKVVESPIENNNTVSKKFHLNGLTLNVSVKKAPPIHPGWIESQKFRAPLSSTSTPFTANPVEFSPSAMFFEEVEFLINECKNKPLETQTMFDAVAKLCANHIKQCGRLIDNDLESYIDRILTVLDAITKAEGDDLLYDDAIELREAFRSNLIESFFPYIFITKRDYTGKAVAVKLADEVRK